MILTRDPGASAGSAGSTATAAIALLAFAATEFAIPSAVTLRKSTRTVSGSGRVATYGTGSLASMRSDAPFALARELILLRRVRGTAAAPESDPAALTSAPAA